MGDVVPNNILDTLDVFYGESSPTNARIYARLEYGEIGSTWRLGGYVSGPHCAIAQTLPAKLRLTDLGRSDDPRSRHRLLAGAQIPDPCFWSPRLPSRYKVHVELRDGNRCVETSDRWLGIRHLGTRGRNLFLEGKRWVVRGVAWKAADEPDLNRWREVSAALITDNPDEGLCQEASCAGVLVIARVFQSPGGAAEEVRAASRWPALGVALVDQDATVGDDLKQAAPNILWAQYSSLDHPATPRGWADVVVREVGDPAVFANEVRDCPRPVFALRPHPTFTSLAGARAACDQLQRDLAPYVDVAGYLVA